MLAFGMTMLDEPGDRLAFEDIYIKYKGKMFALAFSVTGNYHDAEEAVSQAFFSAAKNFRKIRSRTEGERAAYISVITKNHALDIVRKRDRAETVITDEDILTDTFGKSADLSDRALSDHSFNRIVEAIRALPERYSSTLYLHYVTGLSIKEISSSLGESEANIKKRLQRAREKLKEQLEDMGIGIDQQK